MKNVLIINGHQYYENIAEGNLTNSIIEKTKYFLEQNNFNVKISNIDKGFDKKEEGDNLLWANYVILQYPVYWMGLPWITKKYFDEVLAQGVHYLSDGRSRTDSSKLYGSGGLLKGKYMLSLTYNCPESEFGDIEGFFEGLTLDQANIATHKIFQFLGLQKMKSFSIHDIFKGNLDINIEMKKLENRLKENFNIGE